MWSGYAAGGLTPTESLTPDASGSPFPAYNFKSIQKPGEAFNPGIRKIPGPKWEGEMTAGERVLASVEGMDGMHNWQPQLHAFGARIWFPIDAVKRVMFPQGRIGWFYGLGRNPIGSDNYAAPEATKFYRRDRRMPQVDTRIIFGDDTPMQLTNGNVADFAEEVASQITGGGPLAVETFIDPKKPVDRIPISLLNHSNVEVPTNTVAAHKNAVDAGAPTTHLLVNHKVLPPGTRVYAALYFVDRGRGRGFPTTVFFANIDAPGDRPGLMSSERMRRGMLIELGILTQTYYRGNPYITLSLCCTPLDCCHD